MTTLQQRISPGEDIIDTRDIIERVEELESYEEELDETEAEELAELKGLIEDLEANCDERPEYGITMILDDYFTDYAEQLAEDIGAIGREPLAWPLCHIDWEAAAEDLQRDYYWVHYGNYAYWAR